MEQNENSMYFCALEAILSNNNLARGKAENYLKDLPTIEFIDLSLNEIEHPHSSNIQFLAGILIKQFCELHLSGKEEELLRINTETTEKMYKKLIYILKIADPYSKIIGPVLESIIGITNKLYEKGLLYDLYNFIQDSLLSQNENQKGIGIYLFGYILYKLKNIDLELEAEDILEKFGMSINFQSSMNQMYVLGAFKQACIFFGFSKDLRKFAPYFVELTKKIIQKAVSSDLVFCEFCIYDLLKEDPKMFKNTFATFYDLCCMNPGIYLNVLIKASRKMKLNNEQVESLLKLILNQLIPKKANEIEIENIEVEYYIKILKKLIYCIDWSANENLFMNLIQSLLSLNDNKYIIAAINAISIIGNFSSEEGTRKFMKIIFDYVNNECITIRKACFFAIGKICKESSHTSKIFHLLLDLLINALSEKKVAIDSIKVIKKICRKVNQEALDNHFDFLAPALWNAISINEKKAIDAIVHLMNNCKQKSINFCEKVIPMLFDLKNDSNKGFISYSISRIGNVIGHDKSMQYLENLLSTIFSVNLKDNNNELIEMYYIESSLNLILKLMHLKLDNYLDQICIYVIEYLSDSMEVILRCIFEFKAKCLKYSKEFASLALKSLGKTYFNKNNKNDDAFEILEQLCLPELNPEPKLRKEIMNYFFFRLMQEGITHNRSLAASAIIFVLQNIKDNYSPNELKEMLSHSIKLSQSLIYDYFWDKRENKIIPYNNQDKEYSIKKRGEKFLKNIIALIGVLLGANFNEFQCFHQEIETNVINRFLHTEMQYLSIQLIVDILDFCNANLSSSTWNKYVDIILIHSNDANPEIRQECLYCIGTLSRYASQLKPILERCFQSIFEALKNTKPEQVKESSWLAAQENGVASLGKIILNFQKEPNEIPNFIELWLNNLPLRAEEIEGISQHEQFIDLALNNIDLIYDNSKASFSRLLRICIGIVDSNFYKASTIFKIKQFLKSRLDQIKYVDEELNSQERNLLMNLIQ